MTALLFKTPYLIPKENSYFVPKRTFPIQAKIHLLIPNAPTHLVQESNSYPNPVLWYHLPRSATIQLLWLKPDLAKTVGLVTIQTSPPSWCPSFGPWHSLAIPRPCELESPHNQGKGHNYPIFFNFNLSPIWVGPNSPPARTLYQQKGYPTLRYTHTV